ncbi:MAG TPA: serine/threonine-protein kinase, partial [Pyrinomonadaceae bacterium]|nr:serine/threonine-protein kinase [Pyrinomonadaceae bacterium]
MIETGRVLQQRYRIDKQIGQGGMGAVYVATDERFGSTVAIKETLCMDDNFRKAIEREARLLNSLKHVALPRVSDHFEEANGQFLVMEYIPGDDVGSMLEPGENKFTVEQILKWADQLLDALDYLHNQQNPVIHRDIKPQNLKITPRGDMILLDFGLAKGNPTDAGNKTAAKSIFGYSRNYASLEQIQGTGTDPRSDLYSLAATLYHLLTNIGPEDALTRAMAVLSQKADPLVPANVINPAVPRGVAGVLQKALSLNADERPASATEMRQMLRESENYAYLADAATVSATAATIPAFGGETKLMPDNTRAFAQQTDVKTEILPTNLSEVTAVHAGSGAAPTPTNVIAANFTTAPSPKRRGFAAAAVGLGLLLVGCLVAGGVYMAKPSVFVGQKEVEKWPDTGSA